MWRRRVYWTAQFYEVPIRPDISNTKLTEMKHLMTLIALVVAVTAGAQIIDTTTTGNAVHMNLNLSIGIPML